MSQSDKQQKALLEMKASAELNKAVAEELLQDDPDNAEAAASILKFNKTENEEEDGNTE